MQRVNQLVNIFRRKAIRPIHSVCKNNVKFMEKYNNPQKKFLSIDFNNKQQLVEELNIIIKQANDASESIQKYLQAYNRLTPISQFHNSNLVEPTMSELDTVIENINEQNKVNDAKNVENLQKEASKSIDTLVKVINSSDKETLLEITEAAKIALQEIASSIKTIINILIHITNCTNDQKKSKVLMDLSDAAMKVEESISVYIYIINSLKEPYQHYRIGVYDEPSQIPDENNDLQRYERVGVYDQNPKYVNTFVVNPQIKKPIYELTKEAIKEDVIIKIDNLIIILNDINKIPEISNQLFSSIPTTDDVRTSIITLSTLAQEVIQKIDKQL